MVGNCVSVEYLGSFHGGVDVIATRVPNPGIEDFHVGEIEGEAHGLPAQVDVACCHRRLDGMVMRQAREQARLEHTDDEAGFRCVDGETPCRG